MINILETPNSGHQYFPVFGNLKVDNMSKYLENFNSVYISNEHTIVPVFSVYL